MQKIYLLPLLLIVFPAYSQDGPPKSEHWEFTPRTRQQIKADEARQERQAQRRAQAQPAYGGRSVQMQEKSTSIIKGGDVIMGTTIRGEPVIGITEDKTVTTTTTRTVSCGQLKAEWDQHHSLLDRMDTTGKQYEQWYARNTQYRQKFIHECE